MTYTFAKKHDSEDIQELKDQLSLFTKPKWITISPDPNINPIKGDKFIEKWRQIFILWYKAIDNGIFVLEVKHERFHWHILINVTDSYKFGIYYRGMIQHNRAQTKIYDGFPAEGINYLFKDIELTRQQLKYYDCIGSYEQIIKDVAYKANLKKINRQNELTHSRQLDYKIQKSTPRCFIESDSDD